MIGMALVVIITLMGCAGICGACYPEDETKSSNDLFAKIRQFFYFD